MKFPIRRTPSIVAAFVAVLILSSAALAGSPLGLELVNTTKVWDQAPHNAFTDLVRFNNKWFVAFREGAAHVSSPPVGDIRVLSSEDGETWQSAALLQTDNADLRDAKLSVTPQGKLMLVSGKRAVDNQGDVYMQSMVHFSDDGTTWGDASEIGEYNWWMWGAQWGPDGASYGVGYDCETVFQSQQSATTRLYRSEDGVNYDTVLSRFAPQVNTNETSLLFRADGSCVALVRRNSDTAIVGTASPENNYSNWTFRELGEHIAGPEIIETPGGHILAAGRVYESGAARTAVGLLDPESGEFTKMLTLPSGGDCSYPGMAIHDGQLLVSYYSSHEGKTSIYLSTMNLTSTPEPTTISLLGIGGLTLLALARRRRR